MRLHGESLSSTRGCPQVIQIPSCIVPFRTQLWPADVTTPVLKGQHSHLCLGPRKALAFRSLSHRCAWSFWVTETHEAVCPVLYLCLWCFWPQSAKFQVDNSLYCSTLCNSYSAIQLTPRLCHL